MRSEQAAPVAPAARDSRPQQEPASRRALRHPRAPFALLLLGTVVVAAVVVDIGLRVSGWALDETVVKQSALHYRHGLPGSLFHDLNARATSRLFSLLLMPIFALWDGDTAVRLARAFSALIFCSTSIPVYLLARRVLRSPWLAAAAGLLAITGPWLTISTTIYTENLAYPLFAWALLAMVWAVEERTWRGDFVVLAAIFLCTITRVQLFALFPAWLVTVWVISWGHGGKRGFARRAWDFAPISHAIVGFGVLFALFRLGTGHLHADVQRLLGAYSELQDRGHVSNNTLLAVAHEVQALALPAFLAAVAALAWFAGSLRGRRDSSGWSFAVIALCVTAVLWLVSAYVQGGFIGDLTEERYFFYVFPLVWVGAFAAIEQPTVAGPRLLAAGIPVVLLFAVLGQPRPLDAQTTFLAPSAATMRNIWERLIAQFNLSGLTTTDAIAVTGIVLLVLGLWVWRRWPGRRLLVFGGLAAALQLFVTGYAIAARDGHVPGVPAQTGGIISLNAWVDHHAGNNQPVFLNNQPRLIDPSAEGWQYVTLFWNSKIRSWANDPASGLPAPVATLNALPSRPIEFEPTIGLLPTLEHTGPFVSYIESPFFQVAGRRLAKGPGNGLELVGPDQPPQALWHATGLQMDGSVDPQKVARLTAWLPPGSNAKKLRITMTFTNPGGAASAVRVRLGRDARDISLAPNATQPVVFTPCVSGRRVSGEARTLTPVGLSDGRQIGGRIASVRVEPATGAGGC